MPYINFLLPKIQSLKRKLKPVSNGGLSMISFNEKISDVSKYLQTLTTKKYSSQVQEAVDKQDKNALAKVCKHAKIPAIYIPSIVSVILSVVPQKWPEEA
jgi:hypothetical protein